MANLTPDSGMTMFLPSGGGAEDNSLESAVRLCIASGTRPTRIQDFTALLDAIEDDTVAGFELIHNGFGTQNVRPTNFGQLNGFPKPTIDWNLRLENVGTYPSEQYDILWCAPELNNIVGYAITIELDVEEIHPTLGIASNNPTWTFNKGATTPSSSSLSASGGEYRLNIAYPQPSNAVNIPMLVDNFTAGSLDAYFGFTSVSPTMVYQGATTVYSAGFNNYVGTTCGGAVGSAITLYTPTVPTTGGSTDPRWSNPAKLYTDALLTTVAPNGSYYLTSTGGVFYDVYSITDGSGTVTRVQTDCT